MSLRVRQLIPQLSYPQLILDGVIPDIGKTTPALPSKRYTKWVYDHSKSTYGDTIFTDLGLFMEEILWEAITGARTPWPECWTRVCQSPVPPELQSAGKFLGSILAIFKNMFTGHAVQHGREFNYKTVSGHPDFFCESSPMGPWILDVKTTTGFAKMAEETYLQILSYAALARASGFQTNFIGVLLPIQGMILWYNLTGWDSARFLDRLVQEVEWKTQDLAMLNPEYIKNCIDEESTAIIEPTLLGTFGRRLVSLRCGEHLSKETVGIRSHESNGRPIQFFIGNPQAPTDINLNDLYKMRQEIKEGTPIFIHASYLINLGTVRHDQWDIKRMIQELQGAQILKANGTVVHVGKHKELDPSVSLDLMERHIRHVLPMTSPESPLLLESPAGEGTELCSSLESMMNFYARFNNDPRFKVTLDSAHIHAMGYDPAWFLHQWVTRWPGSVALVHFNDSSKCRGSRVDEHYFPGLGHIGYKRMFRLHELCIEHNIAMVRE